MGTTGCKLAGLHLKKILLVVGRAADRVPSRAGRACDYSSDRLRLGTCSTRTNPWRRSWFGLEVEGLGQLSKSVTDQKPTSTGPCPGELRSNTLDLVPHTHQSVRVSPGPLCPFTLLSFVCHSFKVIPVTVAAAALYPAQGLLVSATPNCKMTLFSTSTLIRCASTEATSKQVTADPKTLLKLLQW